jgi:hypothetical protein
MELAIISLLKQDSAKVAGTGRAKKFSHESPHGF